MPGCVQSGVVAFDAAYFAVRYPGFSAVGSALLNDYFSEAGILLNNTASSIVRDASTGGRRYILLHMLTAHIAQLNSGANGQAPSGLVGRISAATQGSVNVSTDMGQQPMAAAYYLQTPYGTQFWNMTADLRAGGIYAGLRDGGYGWVGYCG